VSCTVVASDIRADPNAPAVDIDRWAVLAEVTASRYGGAGELTLTFVDVDEIASLNAEFMGKEGPTDVLSFPMNDQPLPGVPMLLGDIVVCPVVAVEQAPEHAGTVDDELALLVVHGVLHVLGHDHAEPVETELMRSLEREALMEFHWDGPPPSGFRQAQD
jgi:probable rRNA maturation factor